MSEFTKIVAKFSIRPPIYGRDLLSVLVENGFNGGEWGTTAYAQVMSRAQGTDYRSTSWCHITQNGFSVVLSMALLDSTINTNSHKAPRLKRIYLYVNLKDEEASSPEIQKAAFEAIQIVADKISTILQDYQSEKETAEQQA